MVNNPVSSTVMIPITVEYEDLFLVIPYYNWGYCKLDLLGYITFATRGPHRIQMMCRAIRPLIPIFKYLNTSNKEAENKTDLPPPWCDLFGKVEVYLETASSFNEITAFKRIKSWHLRTWAAFRISTSTLQAEIIERNRACFSNPCFFAVSSHFDSFYPHAGASPNIEES